MWDFGPLRSGHSQFMEKLARGACELCGIGYTSSRGI